MNLKNPLCVKTYEIFRDTIKEITWAKEVKQCFVKDIQSWEKIFSEEMKQSAEFVW